MMTSVCLLGRLVAPCLYIMDLLRGVSNPEKVKIIVHSAFHSFLKCCVGTFLGSCLFLYFDVLAPVSDGLLMMAPPRLKPRLMMSHLLVGAVSLLVLLKALLNALDTDEVGWTTPVKRTVECDDVDTKTD
eukprot:Blabericola_migrator_1__422@NODE_1100_length_5436_cov_44_427454_g753_i0_p5_GENE_NODE_1100_length_5436_cov_44_427454_g753_i0NODE_1100_length_5436_cov_44_427454_g753_i0_p5_ORF_typecomplete_len130_score16_74MarC/PF01914_17/0_11MarC/PF01914_17/4_5e03_NODE_1100_length_5436_cov_44_427454_g753_i0264653